VELDGRSLERMKGMIEIRDATRALLRAEARPTPPTRS
jgi:hypothetical protein